MADQPMHYVAKDQIGPFEEGPRKGGYVVLNEIVSADTFKLESIEVLEAGGFIVPFVPADDGSNAFEKLVQRNGRIFNELVLEQPGGNLDGETNTIGETSDTVQVEALRNVKGKFVSPEDQDADGQAELITHAKRKKK